MTGRFGRALPGGAWAILATLLVSGCMVGPDYVRPEAPEQKAFQAARGASALEPGEVQWWRNLNDPQLVKYIERGLAENQTIKEAQAHVREARALRGVAAASLMPRVGAGAQYTPSRLSGTAGIVGQFPPGFITLQQDFYEVGFDASWEIDVFGGTRREVRAASARTQANIESYRDVSISVAAEIARNYVELRGAQRRLAIAEKNSDLQEQTLSLVEARMEAAIGSRLEVEQARAQLERTRATIPPLRASIRGSAYRLAVLTGAPPAALLDELLATAPVPNPPDIVPVGLPSDLLLRRPDLRRAENELRAATEEIGAAKADLYPRFYLTGAANPQTSKFVDLFEANSFAWSLGPSISWPVFQAGRITSNIAAFEARRDEALARYRQAVLKALEDVETSLVNYAESRVEGERLASSLEAQTRAAALARERYGEGVKDFLTVLDAERQMRDVEDTLAANESRVLVNLIGLYKALGGSWETAL